MADLRPDPRERVDLDWALGVVAANHAGAEGSFVHALYKLDTFDPASFWMLYTAMAVAGATDPADRPGALHEDALWIYSLVLRSIVWHFDPEDGAHLDGFPERGLATYIDALEWVAHPLIIGRPGYVGDPDFGDELTNPYQDALHRHLGARARRA